jgi:hypothetical protein
MFAAQEHITVTTIISGARFFFLWESTILFNKQVELLCKKTQFPFTWQFLLLSC